jgi:hypothetical protein
MRPLCDGDFFEDSGGCPDQAASQPYQHRRVLSVKTRDHPRPGTADQKAKARQFAGLSLVFPWVFAFDWLISPASQSDGPAAKLFGSRYSCE